MALTKRKGVPGQGSTYNDAAAITPSDSTDLTAICDAWMVSVAGNIKVDMARSGSAIVIAALAGVIYNISITRVYATGTTATGIISLTK